MLLADAVEDGQAGAQQRRGLGRVHLAGHADGGLGAHEDVLGVAAVLGHAVDDLVLAMLEEAALALAAGRVVARVEGAADALAELEVGHAGAELDDVADDLVARDAREHVAHAARRGGDVRVADAAGEDLDEDLAGRGVLQLDVLEGEGPVGLAHHDGLVRLREGGHVAAVSPSGAMCVIWGSSPIQVMLVTLHIYSEGIDVRFARACV